MNTPFAELLRPKTIDDVIGQRHLVGPGKPLHVAFESKILHSMILWGPPGVGKTTLAQLMSSAFDCEWIAISAVFSGVKDIRAAMQLAQQYQAQNKKTILFIDEIHRFNKSQQDALLPYTESGLITLIGATTENPSFEINSALLSRVQVYVLQSLSQKELLLLLQRAINQLLPHLQIEEDAALLLVEHANGDARKLLNLLEQVHAAVQIKKPSVITISFLQQTLSAHMRRFDKAGEQFYNQISALHKSVRGSDPDASLYWFCRMLDGGADPHYLARRIIRMAWEDIGLADPKAMQIVNDAATTYERLGSPEGELALAEAIIYLAVAPKSNAAYTAFNEARAFVKHDKSREVPAHLRNAPTHLMKQLGYGKTYRYPHDEPHGFAAGEQYLPDGIKKPQWYQPTNRGLEQKISEKLAFLQQLNSKKK